MKLDELLKEANGIAIAAILTNENSAEWSVVLINHNKFELKNVLVNSYGYSTEGNEKTVTSQLRHFFETIPAEKTQQIELITPEVFHLNNQYWISFYLDAKIYDKKFIFEPYSIDKNSIEFIEELDAKGIILS